MADTAGDSAKGTPGRDRDGSQHSRLVIGVAGGSGSGKTTVVRRIVESLGPDCVSILDHDRYYRDRLDLRLEDRTALNYDHPDSLETDLMVRHVAELKAGRAVEAPLYDFARYVRRTTTETVEPRRAIIVEGILIFTDAALRAQMDIKVFVDTDDGFGDRPVPRHRQADAPRVRRAEQALRRRDHPAGRPQPRRHRSAAHADPKPRLALDLLRHMRGAREHVVLHQGPPRVTGVLVLAFSHRIPCS